MPFKHEDLANSHDTKVEKQYLDDLEEAHDKLRTAEEAVKWAGTENDDHISSTIAVMAAAAKRLRYMVEAAESDSKLFYEQRDEVWEGHSMFDYHLETAENAEGRALCYFSAWMLDTRWVRAE